MTPLCGTTKTKFFQVDYSLRCFIKYASIFELGQGHTVDFPLHVLSRPTEQEASAKQGTAAYQNFMVTSVSFNHENPGEQNCFFKHTPVSLDLPYEPHWLTYTQVKNDDEDNRSRMVHLNRIIYDNSKKTPLP